MKKTHSKPLRTNPAETSHRNFKELNPPDKTLHYRVRSSTDWVGRDVDAEAIAWDSDIDTPIGVLYVFERAKLLGARALYVRNFWVNPKYKKHGIGQRLYIEMMTELEKRGFLLASKSYERTDEADRVHDKLANVLNGRLITDQLDRKINVYDSVKAGAWKPLAERRLHPDGRHGVKALIKIRQSPLSDAPDVPRGTYGIIQDETDGWFFVDFGEPYGTVACDESELL